MQLLKLNNEIIDLDDSTAIGIDIQSYDIKNIGDRKVNISNTFSIPKTINNMRILEFPDDPQSDSKMIYDILKAEFWVDNLKMIDGKCYIKSISSSRINLVCYNKSDFWDYINIIKMNPNLVFKEDTKNTDPNYHKIVQVIKDGLWYSLLKWISDVDHTYKNYCIENNIIYKFGLENGYGTISNRYNTTFNAVVNKFTQNTDGIYLPLFYSNKFNDISDVSETETSLTLYNSDDSSTGSHFCIYLSTIFEFFEYLFGIDMGVTNKDDIDHNIWNDKYVNKIYIPFRNLIIDGNNIDGYYFGISTITTPLTDVSWYSNDKTCSDLVKSFFKMFNILIDSNDYNTNNDYLFNTKENYQFRRFDDLIDNADIIDFSGNMTDEFTFSTTINNFKQYNYITLSEVYEGGTLINSDFNYQSDEMYKELVCKNKNIESGGIENVILTIDGFKNNGISHNNIVVADMRLAESFKTFSFFIDSENIINCDLKIKNNGIIIKSELVSLKVSNMYSFVNEYNSISKIIEYPKMFTIKKYINLNTIYKLKYFRKYYIQELNGYFFINKISGFNTNTKSASTIELIKIS